MPKRVQGNGCPLVQQGACPVVGPQPDTSLVGGIWIAGHEIRHVPKLPPPFTLTISPVI